MTRCLCSRLSSRKHLEIMNSNSAARKASERDTFQGLVMEAWGLRPVRREIFLLCAIQGCTVDEATAILDTNEDCKNVTRFSAEPGSMVDQPLPSTAERNPERRASRSGKGISSQVAGADLGAAPAPSGSASPSPVGGTSTV